MIGWVLVIDFGDGIHPQPALLDLTSFPAELRLRQAGRMVVATGDWYQMASQDFHDLQAA